MTFMQAMMTENISTKDLFQLNLAKEQMNIELLSN